ncbi:C4-type zinc finger protein, DksA/TraR family [hydrothermal vent metagenome]|uniref:C4-type zinc finger protein, DksA/TraR family n=1 Tax=hydrothermal vent metagenome TaxID=652676 RepID=A0A3B1DXP5_9ZZZZ
MASKKQITELKEILIKRKSVITHSIEDNKDNVLKLKDMDCKDELDFAEASSDSFTSEIIAVKQSKELEEINIAIEAIKDGNYGVCQMCDEDIAIARLKAKPFAKYCILCREIYEEDHIKG